MCNVMRHTNIKQHIIIDVVADAVGEVVNFGDAEATGYLYNY